MKYDFIKNGFKEGDTVYSIIRGPGIIKSINKVVEESHSICVKFNNITVTYDGYGYRTPGDSIPEIFPNEFKVTVPEDMYKTPIKNLCGVKREFADLEGHIKLDGSFGVELISIDNIDLGMFDFEVEEII